MAEVAQVSITITNNNPSYNNYISGYFSEEDSVQSDPYSFIQFSPNSNSVTITFEMSDINSSIEFQITFSNGLKLTEFEVDGQQSIIYDNIK